MKILILERSIPFDPTDTAARPLGARQRGVIALAHALAEGGHQVEIRRNGGADMTHRNVVWRGLDDGHAPFDGAGIERVLVWRDADLLRHPLIGRDVPCWLWFDGDPAVLSADRARLAVLESGARIIFTDPAQLAAFDGDVARSPVVLAPGACPAFPAASNRFWGFDARDNLAVTIANRSTVLVDIVRIWAEYVAPMAPDAVLEIYAHDAFTALSGAMDGTGGDGNGNAPDVTNAADVAMGDGTMGTLGDFLRVALDYGIRVCQPLPEDAMAERLAAARVFLHHGRTGQPAQSGQSGQPAQPGRAAERLDRTGQWICDALGAATPVVSFGGAGQLRLENGQNGYIVPDDAAFGNLAVQILTNRTIFGALSDGARMRRREWRDAARDLEKM